MTTKAFLKQLLFILLFVIIVITLINLWLRFYTNHGQKLVLPNYIGQNYHDVKKDANKKSFRISIADSVHIVGKPGGEIISQNPKPESTVKENRMIYVTTTKYNPDKITVGSLPTLYGTSYESKCKDLSYLNINCSIQSYKHDTGAKDHILEVYYKGKLISSKNGRNNSVEIEKGATLDFVLSKPDGKELALTDYKCMTLDEARFLIENDRLNIGTISGNGEITDEGTAYIVDQSPRATPGATIVMGEVLNFRIQQNKPSSCK